MPTVVENKRQWDGSYHWDDTGDEWSREWGGADVQWFGSLLPRVHAFLPVGTILEIAPGQGRWTQFLKDHCDRLVAVDLSQKCIDACRRRFAAEAKIDLHVNDGTSLDMVADDSIDLVFSFDSLVHVEQDVIEAYLRQLAKKLRADGVGFLHHSNLAECYRRQPWLRGTRIGRKLGSALGWIGAHEHWRGRSMSAQRFVELATAAGFQCIAQEKIPWLGDPQPLDCISTFTRTGSRFERPNRVHENADFLREARIWRSLSPLYGGASLGEPSRGPRGT